MKGSRPFLLFLSILLFCVPGAAQVQERLPADHPKYIVAEQVFDDLVRAFGDGRTRPGLRLLPRGVKSRNQVTWFAPDQNLVTLEEQVYDLCVSLGADSLNALAFLLGHELAHYYKDHGWVHDFGNAFADLGVGQQLGERSRDPTERVRIETEADYFGGFFGYIAGYRTLEAVGEILPRIYTEYGLDENLLGYPPLRERQEIARRAREKLDRMVPVFEAGHHLLLVKRYEEAARCFDFIARDFASREILNNAGVSRALEAIDLFESGELRFAYPFELDAETRLKSPRSSPGRASQRNQRRERRLREARELFEQARARDPRYTAAYINLAGIADLQGEYEEAEFLAGKAVKLTRNMDEGIALAHALIVRGIARVRGGDREGARQDFNEAKKGALSLARLNLAALTSSAEGSTGSSSAAPEKLADSRERIAGMAARDYQTIISQDAIAEVPGADRRHPPIDIYARQAEIWDGLVVEMGFKLFAFMKTRKAYRGETEQGIKISHRLSQVEAAYGPPAYQVAGRQGIHHVYESDRIIFQTDIDDVVQGWMIYTAE